MEINLKKYLAVFIITGAIFATAFYASTFFYNQRIKEIKKIENKIALDFLALEIEADLLSEVSCEEEYASLTTNNLKELGDRLVYLEEHGGTDKQTIRDLKIQYSLFELKDYLFLKRLNSNCEEKLNFIFYFYSNTGDCAECVRQGYVLGKIREENPSVRVYSFDYNIDVPGINTLKRFYGIKAELPALVVDRRVIYGFHDEDALLKFLLP
ncbi:hypothetical protein A3A20_02580 [Candidatus Wolfebacteria bacterium RIFCSPLOWO2_01_FULL_45_19]|uniref:Thioredoxin-like fold domain-containing protein n=1 Tax=Candidatus Wolfebacteria bacterium RIFCSPLOWO2_01_FULL_45_19 TaxID=1802557 RepID=A0A1F8DSR0_9BACT|nr:MAG: hypothetical protein UX23_C0012G0032 [Parcubacteria group bacterium GW2011_GWB1_45_9]OGM91436.1 MAG: hypothetical protein A3A20_02580 [Candidatus Wolfebacteria bacterium RIFCSPLOWO2_01_FULL_45_19]